MIVVTFTPSKGVPFNGVLLKRDSGLCLIAFDQTAERPFSVGWSRLDSSYKIQSKESVRWLHPAMKLAEAGNIEGVLEVYRKEEKERQAERLKKEKSV